MDEYKYKVKRMYELESKKNNFFILILIIILTIFFTILAYTLFLDSHQYTYDQNVVATRVSYAENSNNLEEVIENITECTVGISKIKDIGSTIFLEKSTENLNLGSGVIISSEGYILTNQHVAGEKYSTCYITLKNGVTCNAVVVWASDDLDLAIIKVNMKELPEAILGDSDDVRIGSNAYAIGNPVGYELQRTVTFGIISGTNRTIKVEDEEKKSYLEGLIQTDATINQGNSGGPLINSNGEVIGITTLKIDDADGIGFAIPINIVKPILKKLLETGEFDEPYLGISGYDKDAIPYLSSNINFENGIYVEEVDEWGPLKDSKLKKGDIIEKIDGIEIDSMNQLKEYVYSKNVGDIVMLTVKKNNKTFEISSKLAKNK